MDATARTAAVLAAAALLVVPLVNALVLESQQTADRQVRDPPQDPPEDPPQGEYEGGDDANVSEEIPRDRRGAAGGNCTPVPEDAPAAAWNHPAPSENPGAAAQTRAQSPAERSFRVSDLHVGLAVRLQVTDLAGDLEARVHPADAPDDAAFAVDASNRLADDLERNGTVTRTGALTSGDWTATLETDGAAYRSLEFTVVRAICQEAAS